jgi:hypothetical protein
MESVIENVRGLLRHFGKKRTELSDAVTTEAIFRRVGNVIESTPDDEGGLDPTIFGDYVYEKDHSSEGFLKLRTSYFSGQDGLYFEFSPDSFPDLTDGERVLVKYRTRFLVTTDNIPSGSSQAGETRRKIKDYIYEGYERIPNPFPFRVTDRRAFYRPPLLA